jgi:hypothetical protein
MNYLILIHTMFKMPSPHICLEIQNSAVVNGVSRYFWHTNIGISVDLSLCCYIVNSFSLCGYFVKNAMS